MGLPSKGSKCNFRLPWLILSFIRASTPLRCYADDGRRWLLLLLSQTRRQMGLHRSNYHWLFLGQRSLLLQLLLSNYLEMLCLRYHPPWVAAFTTSACSSVLLCLALSLSVCLERLEDFASYTLPPWLPRYFRAQKFLLHLTLSLSRLCSAESQMLPSQRDLLWFLSCWKLLTIYHCLALPRLNVVKSCWCCSVADQGTL